MKFDRRDMLKGAVAVASVGSLSVLAGAGSASAAARPTLMAGATGSHVLTLQRRLHSLGYWLGAVDGHYGDLTRQAVVALQKVTGLLRDGECGPMTWAKVNAGTRPKARSTRGHVIEINKKTQTLLVADSGVVKQIYNTSTGTGKRYQVKEKGKGKVKEWKVALTPSGAFRVFRQVNKWDKSPLGELWRPKYFNGGIAVHGYPSVPSTPASHGCVRVSVPAMNKLWGAGGLAVGTTVLVY